MSHDIRPSVGDLATFETPAAAPPGGVTPPPGVPGYEIEGVLGRGGMGVVYRARHLALKRVVALKMILAGGHASDVQVARFRTEAEAVARVQHPGIVQVFEVGETNGMPWCSLEFCPGGSLSGKLAGDPMPPADAARMMVRLARAMHACHQAGILHRDLKPANILLDADGEPKITDFGLAKALDSETGQTQSGAILGTPSYMPPEQARGDSDELGPVSDVYSLGAVLYELLVGRPPFRGATVRDTIVQVLADDPVPPRQFNRNIAKDLETVCLKCLRKETKQRYATATDLADDLQRYLDGKPVVARPVSAATRAVKWVKRHPLRATVAALGMVIAGLGGTVYAVYEQAKLDATKFELVRLTDKGNQDGQISTVVRAAFAAAEKAALDEKDIPDNRKPEFAERTRAAWADVLSQFRTAERLIDKAAFPVEDGLKEQIADQIAKAKALSADRKRDSDLLADRTRQDWWSMAFAGESKSVSRRKAAEAGEQGLARLGLADLTQDDSPERFAALEGAYLPATRLAGIAHDMLLLWAQAEAPADVGATELDAVIAEGTPDEAVAKAERLLARADALRAAYAGRPDAPRFADRTRHARRAAYLARLGRAGEAARQRELAAAVKGDAPFDLVLRATAEEQAGRPDEALKATRAALDLEPGNHDALFLQALCHLRIGEYNLAEADLQACLNQRPEGAPWVKTYLGFARLQSRNFASARSLFEEVLDKAADQPRLRYVVLNNVGVLRLREKQYDAAVAAFTEAAALFPNDSLPHTNIGAVEADRDNLPAALAAYDKAVELAPGVGVLRYQRARVHQRLKNKADALADFRASVALDGPDRDGPDGAVGTSWEAETRRSRHVEARMQAGRLLQTAGDHKAALAEYDRAIALRPELPLAFRYKAESYVRLGLFTEAGRELDRYSAVRPNAPAAVHVTRGIVFEKQGKLDKAIEAHTLAMTRLGKPDPENERLLDPTPEAVVRVARGWVYVMREAERLAEADFQAVLDADANNADALVGRATARVMQGKYALAVRDAENAIKALKPGADDRFIVLYKGARVYSMAAVRAEAATTASQRTALEQAYSYQERSAEFLRQAMELKPPPDRGRYWREAVMKDPAFGPILRGRPMQALMTEMAALP